MKIKSNFKDYYDHIAHTVMNGGDDKVVYVRTRIKDLDYGNTDYPFHFTINKVSQLPTSDNITKVGDIKYQYAWLIIAGKYIPIARHYKQPIDGISPYHDELDGFSVVSETSPIHDRFFSPWGCRIKRDEVYPVLVKMSKDLGHPVFVITSTNYNNVRISRKCPNLGRMGLAKVYSDMDIYKEIYSFISTEMRGDPDVMPALKPPMTDKEKVSSHGFDLKQSFRHRK